MRDQAPVIYTIFVFPIRMIFLVKYYFRGAMIQSKKTFFCFLGFVKQNNYVEYTLSSICDVD